MSCVICGARVVEGLTCDCTAEKYKCRSCGKLIDHEGVCSKGCNTEAPWTYGKAKGLSHCAHEGCKISVSPSRKAKTPYCPEHSLAFKVDTEDLSEGQAGNCAQYGPGACDCADDIGTPDLDPPVQKATREWLLQYLEDATTKILATAKAKNADYAGATPDPFGNFTRVEGLGICSTEVGFLTRMTDKICRIASLVKSGNAQVKDESVLDTLLDLSCYSLLMAAYLTAKKEGKL